MASRFSNKADPAIKKNVRRARSAARKARNLHAPVVAASLAATIFAWALFSDQDARAIEAARTANLNQTALVTPVPAQDTAVVEVVTGQSLLRLPVPPFIPVFIP
jgi:type IV secretory pathway VirB10-like protein